MGDTIRVGLIGAGANTKLQHIPGFQAIDGVEIVSVANRSRESGQRIADEYGIPTVYDSWTELIEAPDSTRSASARGPTCTASWCWPLSTTTST